MISARGGTDAKGSPQNKSEKMIILILVAALILLILYLIMVLTQISEV